MIEYKDGLMTMDLVDLEHCGFDCDLFDAELQMAGIDLAAARWPVVLMVNFRGGRVVSDSTSSQTLERVKMDKETFDTMVKKLIEEKKKMQGWNND